MPPLPDVPSVVIVRVSGTNQGTGWQNIFHLQYSGTAPAVADLNSVCTSVLTAYATNFLPLCNTNVALVGATAADLTNRGSSTGSATNTSPGTRAGTAMTNQVACVVSWVINSRYRGGHPRTYLPAGVLGDVTSGRLWAGAYITSAGNAASAFRTALNAITVSGATYKMVSVQYIQNKVALANPVPYTIQSSKIHTRIDTQRKRLGKEIA